MLRSMTGFGRCVMEDADWTQTWEIRSVNNRHLDLKWRLPLQARGLESRLERVVRRFAARGRMEITLTLQQRGAAANLRFDAAQASAMLDQVAALADLPRGHLRAGLQRPVRHPHALGTRKRRRGRRNGRTPGRGPYRRA